MKNMRIGGWMLAACLAATAGSARAEEAKEPFRTEIGAGLVGLTVADDSRTTTTSFSLPADSNAFALGPLVHAAFNVSPHVELQPQAGLFYVTSGHGESFHVLSLAGQVGYLFRGVKESSPYVFGRARVDDYGGSDIDGSTETGLGGGVGYRIVAGDRGVVRLDGRFDHVFGKDGRPGTNLYSVALGIGLRL